MKRKAEADEERGKKKARTSSQDLPGLQSSGHGCPSCKMPIALSSCVQLFTACGHIFHSECLESKSERCPVCLITVSEEYPCRTIMLRYARHLLGMMAADRVEVLKQVLKKRIELIGADPKPFYIFVNERCFQNRLPQIGNIGSHFGRICTKNYILSEDRKTVDIFVRSHDGPLWEKNRLFETMWDIYMDISDKKDVEQMFADFALFEDMYM